MRKSLLFILLISFFLTNINYSFANEQNQIIAKINGEDIYQERFTRLLNAQKKRFYKELDLNPLISPAANPEITLKREALVEKAIINGVSVDTDTIHKAWIELISKYGNIDNLQNEAKKINLTLADIRKRLEENLLIEKNFEEEVKDKLIEKIVNETLLLQAAKIRGFTASEDEITSRLNLIKKKQGGEAGFTKFLEENNASLEDAKAEIKNQLLIQLVKDKIKNLNTYLTIRKTKSDIIIYTNKLFPQDSDTLANIEELKPDEKEISLQANTNTLPQNPPKADEETNNLLAEEIIKESKEDPNPNIRKNDSVINEEMVDNQNTNEPDPENKIFISDIKEDTVIQPITQTPPSLKPEEGGLRKLFNVTKNANEKQESNQILVPGIPIVTTQKENLPEEQEANTKNGTPVFIPQPPTAQKETGIANNTEPPIENQPDNSSKVLKELRRKLEQRRFVNR